MIEKSISLKPYNTFGFDIQSQLFTAVRSAEDLKSIWKTTLIPQSNTLILGGGSNILFTQNYPGLILKNEIKMRSLIKENNDFVWLKIGGGENWHQAVLWAVENGWGGIENLSLIPGTVGASPIQNIGAYGVELEQVFESLEAFNLDTGKVEVFTHHQCRFGYRDSIFKNEVKGRYFILNVTLKLTKKSAPNISYGDIQNTLDSWGIKAPTIADVSDAVIQIRQSKLPDPLVIGNCGSFFKNPVIPIALLNNILKNNSDLRSFPSKEGHVKIPAAWLIEKSGWKGYRKGDSGVHESQALVLVNYGNALGSEIFSLAKTIQSDVFQNFGVELDMEVNVC